MWLWSLCLPDGCCTSRSKCLFYRQTMILSDQETLTFLELSHRTLPLRIIGYSWFPRVTSLSIKILKRQLFLHMGPVCALIKPPFCTHEKYIYYLKNKIIPVDIDIILQIQFCPHIVGKTMSLALKCPLLKFSFFSICFSFLLLNPCLLTDLLSINPFCKSFIYLISTPNVGLELMTPRSRVTCSSNWASPY